jgi:predicted nucleic acid-binding protein
VNDWIDSAEVNVTGLITRVEVAAAIARARKMKMIPLEETQKALSNLRSDWESFRRLPITENTVIRGDSLAVEHDLRGYDATHLACALIWQETIGDPVTLASFDVQLLKAARSENMAVLPS